MKIAKIIISLSLAILLAVAVFSFAVNTDWEVEHRMEIEASPATIWKILADLENYPNWNRYSPNVTGKFAVGEPIVVEAKLGSRVQLVENQIVSIKPQEELCWHSRGKLAHGLRCRWLTEQDNGKTLLVHHEVMAGPLAWLIKATLFETIQQGLQLVNESLAAEAERVSSQP